MATQAHCAYCFESLAASLEKRPALSLHEVEALWEKYNTDPTTTSELEEPEPEPEDAASVDPAYKPAAISRLLAPSPSSASSSSLHSTSSTPSGTSEASSATSSGTSSSLFSRLTGRDKNAAKTNRATAPQIQTEEEEHPLFVTWNTLTRHGDKRLRGCIGTFEAQDLDAGLRSYALTSAFDDTRFSPITKRELPSLDCAVTLLTDFEPANNVMDWEVGVHGLRISFTERGRRYGATYLPDVAREQGWTKEEALVSLMRKAGWSGRGDEWRKVDVKVVRYQGKKVSLGFAEWREWRDWVDEEMDDQ